MSDVEAYKVSGQITAYYDDILYSAKYDAYYNTDTGEWLEKKCDDPECEFCAGRPENALI